MTMTTATFPSTVNGSLQEMILDVIKTCDGIDIDRTEKFNYLVKFVIICWMMQNYQGKPQEMDANCMKIPH